MSKPGPQRTPTAVLENRGSWRSKDRREHEPERLIGDFSPPEDLSPDARDYWEAMMPRLNNLGIISATDLPMFRLLCETWSDYMLFRENRSGDQHTISKLRAELLKYSGHFGLTPATRSNIRAEKKPEKDKKYFRPA
jgi:phage terminase small subunit